MPVWCPYVKTELSEGGGGKRKFPFNAARGEQLPDSKLQLPHTHKSQRHVTR